MAPTGFMDLSKTRMDHTRIMDQKRVTNTPVSNRTLGWPMGNRKTTEAKLLSSRRKIIIIGFMRLCDLTFFRCGNNTRPN